MARAHEGKKPNVVKNNELKIHDVLIYERKKQFKSDICDKGIIKHELM